MIVMASREKSVRCEDSEEVEEKTTEEMRGGGGVRDS